MLRLVLPAPPTPPVSLVPTVHARWEPGHAGMLVGTP